MLPVPDVDRTRSSLHYWIENLMDMLNLMICLFIKSYISDGGGCRVVTYVSMINAIFQVLFLNILKSIKYRLSTAMYHNCC